MRALAHAAPLRARKDGPHGADMARDMTAFKERAGLAEFRHPAHVALWGTALSAMDVRVPQPALSRRGLLYTNGGARRWKHFVAAPPRAFFAAALVALCDVLLWLDTV